MMGERQVQQDALFYEFSLERHVPEKHLLRAIDRFVELDELRAHLVPFYNETGRPSIESGAADPDADWPEVTKRPDLAHKRTNHELRRPCEGHRAAF